jgi:sorting nexin-1/2
MLLFFSFLAYRVHTRTNMKPFKQTEFGVMRRFSDFLGLHEKLTQKYARRGRIIPPAPEKSLVHPFYPFFDNLSSN